MPIWVSPNSCLCQKRFKTQSTKQTVKYVPKFSLDLPTGFEKSTGITIFIPDIILALAAMKTELIPLLTNLKIFVADLVLPKEVCTGLGIEQPKGFSESGIVKYYTN